MTKDDFLISVKLITGIEIRLGHEYYWGHKNGRIKPTEFMNDGIMYEYLSVKLKFRNPVKKAFASYEQLMEFVNDIIEMIPDKIHHHWMIHP